MEGIVMDWLEITVETSPEGLDALVGSLEDLGVEGLVINDESSIREFLVNNPKSWDFVDDEVFSRLRGTSSVQFYLEDSAEGNRLLSEYKQTLPGRVFSACRVRDEDWQDNWKKYFKPLEIGRRLLIVPAWETPPEATGRTILRIEPQLAFGTGSHASTRLCLTELENHRAGAVLDLGCGSGILAVAALLLGAGHAVCGDIAPDASAVCYANARLNDLPEGALTAHTGDILDAEFLRRIAGGRRYDVIFANIIADVIIPLARHIPELLAPGGVFICSGIIEGRQGDVAGALHDGGLEIISACSADGWHMFSARSAAEDTADTIVSGVRP
jgi:ribosomal protein L11 methyltransferase